MEEVVTFESQFFVETKIMARDRADLFVVER